MQLAGIAGHADSGLVDIHSHTYFHRRVFAGTWVLDAVRPGCVTTASDAVYSPYLDLDARPAELDPAAFYGLPLFHLVDVPSQRSDASRSARLKFTVMEGPNPR